jgi:hypothetical protein
MPVLYRPLDQAPIMMLFERGGDDTDIENGSLQFADMTG